MALEIYTDKLNNTTAADNNKIAKSADLKKRELFDRFIQFIDVKPQSAISYYKAIKQFFKYLDENGIINPTRADVVKYRDFLRENYKPTTVQSYIVALRLFFKWLYNEGIVTANIAENIKSANVDRAHKKDYLTTDQISHVLGIIDQTTVQGLRDYALIFLMVTCGLRTIEVIRANVEDLRVVGDNIALYVQGKGQDEKADFVIVPTEVEKSIRMYHRAAAQNKEQGQGSLPAGGNPLFMSFSNKNSGERLTTRSIRRIIKERFLAAGYDSERLTAHSLRHTAVTLSILGGANLDEAQQFARHANISTTQIYAHHLDKSANRCAGIIFSSISGATSK